MRGQQLLAKGFPGDLAVADQFLYPQGETIQPVDAGHALAKVDPLGRFPHREPPTDRLAQIIARPARGAFGDRSHRGGFGLEGDPVPRRSPRGDIVHDQLAHVGRQHRHGQLTGLGRRRFGVERGLGKLIDRLIPHHIGQAHAAEGDPQHQYLRQGHAVDHRHQQDHATHDPQRRPDGRALRAEGFPLVRGVQHRQDRLDEEQEAQHQQQKAVEQAEQVTEGAEVGARQRIGQADLVDGAAQETVQQPDADVRLGRSQLLRRERLILGQREIGQTERHAAE